MALNIRLIAIYHSYFCAILDFAQILLVYVLHLLHLLQLCLRGLRQQGLQFLPQHLACQQDDRQEAIRRAH